MSDPFVGEVRPVGFTYAPQGWALCNGQTLPISQNTALFSLVGIFYGGNGTTTFGLPDLRGAVAIGMGQGAGLSPYYIGQAVGAATISLGAAQLPAHNHAAIAAGARATATSNSPAGNAWAKAAGGDLAYATGTPNIALSAESTGTAGSSQPHNNMMPYLAVNFIIALQGIFPSRP